VDITNLISQVPCQNKGHVNLRELKNEVVIGTPDVKVEKKHYKQPASVKRNITNNPRHVGSIPEFQVGGR
jgi:hypothetical protein